MGSIRAICVWCERTSETRMAYGSGVRREGRSRPWAAYQSRTRRWNDRRRPRAIKGPRPELDGDRDFLGEEAGSAVVARLRFQRRLLVGAGRWQLGDRATGMEAAA